MPRHRILLASGSNGSGQLGIGHKEDVSVSTPCRFSHATETKVKDKGKQRMSISTDGPPIVSERLRVEGSVVRLSSGAGHTLVFTRQEDAGSPSTLPTSSSSDNRTGRRLWVVGSNQYGALGPTIAKEGCEAFQEVKAEDLVGAAGLSDSKDVIYYYKDIATCWSTSYVVLARVRRNLAGKNRDLSDLDLGDVVVSFGSNDFAELGIGTQTPSKGVHIVKLPQRANGSVDWKIHRIYGSQRHVVVLATTISARGHEDTPAIEPTKVIGWGASRHGQLTPMSWSSLQEVNSKTVHSDLSAPLAPQASTSKRPDARKSSRSAPVGRSRNAYPAVTPRPTVLDLDPIFATLSSIDSTPLSGNSRESTSIGSAALGASHTILRTKTGVLIPLGSNAKGQMEGLGGTSPMEVEDVGCSWNGTLAVARHQMTDREELLQDSEDNKRIQHASGESRFEVGGEEDWRRKISGLSIWTTGTNHHGQLGRGPEAPNGSFEPISLPLSTRGPSAANGIVSNSISDVDGRWEMTDFACGSEHYLLATAFDATRPSILPSRPQSYPKSRSHSSSSNIDSRLKLQSLSQPPSPGPSSLDNESTTLSSRPTTVQGLKHAEGLTPHSRSTQVPTSVSPNPDVHSSPDPSATHCDDQLNSTDRLFAWGWNEHGNLGLGNGDLKDRYRPTEVPIVSSIRQLFRMGWSAENDKVYSGSGNGSGSETDGAHEDGDRNEGTRQEPERTLGHGHEGKESPQGLSWRIGSVWAGCGTSWVEVIIDGDEFRCKASVD